MVYPNIAECNREVIRTNLVEKKAENDEYSPIIGDYRTYRISKIGHKGRYIKNRVIKRIQSDLCR